MRHSNKPSSEQTFVNGTFIRNLNIGLQVSNEILNTVRDTIQSVDKILNESRTKYIDGIKDSVFSGVNHWIESPGNIFTLFGRMGTGKSFFAARLFDKMRSDADVIYYSAQQTHSGTTVLKNMLYTVAYKMTQLPGNMRIRGYLGNHPLPSDIDGLTEDIFIKSFETAEPDGNVVFIIDGLDEYAREDCAVFLNALRSRKSRIHSKVKIFFTGRPEDYIKSYLPHSNDVEYYDIAEHNDSSRNDCIRFIEELSQEKGVSLSNECRDLLVEKGEYSLNYLELFMEENKDRGLIANASEILNAPSGVYDYYAKQLQKYFTEAGKLEFYNTELRTIIAALVAAKRPLTDDELCAIAKIGRSKLYQLVDESTPILVKKDGVIRFYQDAMSEFFTSSECPKEYRIIEAEGDAAFAGAAYELLMRNRFKRLDYFRLFSHEHIISALDNDPFSNELWDTLFLIFDRCITSFSITDRIAEYILDRGNDFTYSFFTELGNSSTNEITRDRIFMRFLSIAQNEPVRKEVYRSVLSQLSRAPFYKFYELISKSRHERLTQKNYAAALAAATEAQRFATVTGSDAVTLTRKTLCLDEIIRNSIDTFAEWRTISEAFSAAFDCSAEVSRLVAMEGDLSLCQKRDLSVLYDRLAIWLVKYDSRIMAEDEREMLAAEAAKMLGIGETKSLFALAIEALHRELDLSGECYSAEEFDSQERLIDMLPALKNIARIRTSYPECRDDLETEGSVVRTLDTYELIIKMAREPDGPRGKINYISEAVAFAHAISDNYAELDEGERAASYAGAAIDFVKRIAEADGDTDYADYYTGYAYCFMARLLSRFGGVTEEALEYYGMAITAYVSAAKKHTRHTKEYATAAALVSAEIADALTKERLHGKAISYRQAALTQLEEALNSASSASNEIRCDYEGQRIYLHLNKVFSAGPESCTEKDLAEIFESLFALILLYEADNESKASMEGYLSCGYVLATVYAAALNSERSVAALDELRSKLTGLGLCELIGGACEGAYTARFTAEIAAQMDKEPDEVARLYLIAINKFKENTEPASPDDILLAPAACYREISDAYRMAEDWQSAKKYTALEINEINILCALPGGNRFRGELADCYYRYAVMLEYEDFDETDAESGTAADFYLTALKLSLDFGIEFPSDSNAQLTAVNCLTELYGIIKEHYEAMQELIESDAERDEVLVYVNEGLQIAENIHSLLSDNLQRELDDIIDIFKKYINFSY